MDTAQTFLRTSRFRSSGWCQDVREARRNGNVRRTDFKDGYLYSVYFYVGLFRQEYDRWFSRKAFCS